MEENMLLAITDNIRRLRTAAWKIQADANRNIETAANAADRDTWLAIRNHHAGMAEAFTASLDEIYANAI